VASALDPPTTSTPPPYRRHLAATITVRALTVRWRGRDGVAAGPTDPRTSEHDVRRPRTCRVVVTVNGAARRRDAGAAVAVDLLRHDLRLTGTHVVRARGVRRLHVLLDGEPVRSCLTFAVMVDGARITTVEGLAGPGGELGPVQRAFRECHGLQCGFCTPGFLLLATELLGPQRRPSDDEIAEALGGNLCRCTGYVNIVRSVRRAVELSAAAAPDGTDGQEPAP
jgi:carbon-monoxide dehydrogenase small subunit